MYFNLQLKNVRVSIPPEEPTPEPDIEDDDAELILEKVEEEMMAEYDDDDQDILHIDDITKLYGQHIVSAILLSDKRTF
jgi:estrogen-related receptor beta like 1